MKLLLLTFYFPPDLSAGSFRSQALVNALINEGPEDLEIDVLTTSPNRYRSFREKAPASEQINRAHVLRIPVPLAGPGVMSQIKAFANFAKHVIRITKQKKWDLVIATSSRLMTAILAAYVAKRAGALLYLDIRDLFIDTFENLFVNRGTRIILPLLRRLERWTIKSAVQVNLVSSGFLKYMQNIEPGHSYRNFTNGIDREFLDLEIKPNHRSHDHLPLVLYAGNIGDGQGLHRILPEVAAYFEGKVNFRIIGDGGRIDELRSALDGVKSVQLYGPVPRGTLIKHYRNADILFLHLNDHAAFRKVLPSKIFEYAATNLPILAGVAGYPAEFLAGEVRIVELFNPCDAKGMIAAVERLLLSRAMPDRTEFCEKYSRERIMAHMARDIFLTIGSARNREF